MFSLFGDEYTHRYEAAKKAKAQREAEEARRLTEINLQRTDAAATSNDNMEERVEAEKQQLKSQQALNQELAEEVEETEES